MSSALKGLDEMISTLNTVKDRGQKRVIRAGVNGALTPLVRAMRAAVNASPASKEVKRQARKTLGKGLRKTKGTHQGKAGFAVGKQSKAKKEAAGKGVGISSTNIHWFVLGTTDRYTGTRTWKTRHGQARSRTTGNARRFTGRIDDTLGNLLGPAAASAGPAMLEAARSKMTKALASEAKRARRKKG